MKTVGILVCMMLTGRVLFAQTTAPNDSVQTRNTYVGVSGFTFFRFVEWSTNVLPEVTIQNNRMFCSAALLFRIGSTYYTSIHAGNKVDIGGQLAALYKLNRQASKNNVLLGVAAMQMHGKMNYEFISNPGSNLWTKSPDATLLALQFKYQLHLGKGCYISFAQLAGEQFAYGKHLPAKRSFEMGTALGFLYRPGNR